MVDELIPGQMKLAEVQQVLQLMLREQVPIRQLAFGADISFVVALLAGAGTTYSYLARPSVEASVNASEWNVGVRGRF